MAVAVGVGDPGLKLTSRIGCSSMPVLEAPVAVMSLSKKPTPVIVAVRLTGWRLVVTLRCESICERAFLMLASIGLVDATQTGFGASEIIDLPPASWMTRW